MFKIDPENPFKGPHQNQEPAIAGADLSEAEAALVLVHGRGASAQNILMLAEELKEPTLHYIAPQAYRFTWYPHSFLVPLEQNQPGLNSALQVIYDRVADLKGKGFEYNRILLAGFSQGACLVLEFAARHPARYGGVIGLSGGLIGDSVAEENYSGSLEGTPVFLGCSDIDPHIPVDRVHKTGDVFKHLGAELTKKVYPGMAHTVSRDELENMKQIIRSVTRG